MIGRCKSRDLLKQSRVQISELNKYSDQKFVYDIDSWLSITLSHTILICLPWAQIRSQLVKLHNLQLYKIFFPVRMLVRVQKIWLKFTILAKIGHFFGVYLAFGQILNVLLKFFNLLWKKLYYCKWSNIE